MKKQFFFLIFVIVALCLVHSVSAANFETPTVKIIPDKTSFAPGDTVSLSVTVLLTSSGDSTFPATNTLKAQTELDDPEWVYAVVKNGNPPPGISSGKSFINFAGFELDYPSSSNEISITFDLQGKIPEVSTTQDVFFFMLTQSDGSGKTVSGGEYIVERLAVNPGDIDKLRDIVEADLQNFDEKIQDKLITGVDVAAAKAKYDDARTKFIQSATASYSDANTLLTAAQTLISEGETLLNQAWAQKAINDAQATIDSTSFYITDFKVNRSLTNDARVLNIETKIESAQSSLNSAKSLFNEKNYPQAYTLAETANTKAGEALTFAETLYGEVSKGIIPDVGGVGIFLIIGIIVIVGIIGVVVYRRYTSWDELG